MKRGGFSLGLLAARVRIGRRGPLLTQTDGRLAIRRPDDSDYGSISVAPAAAPAEPLTLAQFEDLGYFTAGPAVADLVELAAVAAGRRRQFQVRFVGGAGADYWYDADSAEPDDGRNIVLPLDGAGRWKLARARLPSHADLPGLAADDHPQYQRRTERAAPNGYATLNGEGVIPLEQRTAIYTLESGASIGPFPYGVYRMRSADYPPLRLVIAFVPGSVEVDILAGGAVPLAGEITPGALCIKEDGGLVLRNLTGSTLRLRVELA